MFSIMLKIVLLLFSNVTAIHTRYNIIYYHASASYSDHRKTRKTYQLELFALSTENYSNLPDILL